MTRPVLAWNADGLRYLSPMNRKPAQLAPYTVALLLFFLSGMLALVYQVVWARMMTHILGSTALAVGTVLAGFMAGLALGSRVGGRLADRSDNCLRLYAWLEIGIANSRVAATADSSMPTTSSIGPMAAKPA